MRSQIKTEVKEVLEDGSQKLVLTYSSGQVCRVLAKNEQFFWASGGVSGSVILDAQILVALYRALYEHQLSLASKYRKALVETEEGVVKIKQLVDFLRFTEKAGKETEPG